MQFLCAEWYFRPPDDVVVMNDRPAELPSDGDDVMPEANRHRLPSDAVESLRQFEFPPFRLDEKVAGASVAHVKVVLLHDRARSRRRRRQRAMERSRQKGIQRVKRT